MRRNRVACTSVPSPSCARVLESLDPRHSALDIFGSPDDLKLRSCLTLFAQADRPGSIFERLLEKYFDGQADDRTLTMLQGQGRG